MRKEKKDSMEGENKGKQMDNKINIERKSKENAFENKEAKNEIAEETVEQVNENSELNSKQLNELTEKAANLEKEVAELKDRLLRRAAEFDNFKRRTENEQLNLLKYSAESFLIKILPVYDDLERSLSHAKEGENSISIKEGLELILNKFRKVLDDQGVKKIEALGEQFDVNFHEALMQQTVDNAEPNTVIMELEPGYMYKDKVIRHSKVIVSDENSEVSSGK